MVVILCIICLLMLPFPVLAEEENLKYNGEYTLDYLLRNYNVVTFNQNDNPTYDFIEYFEKTNANINIQGPILINGDYYNDDLKTEGMQYSVYNPNNVISHISGETKSYVQTPSTTATNKDFLDYGKLYNSILSESQALADNTEYHINSKNIVIDKPGIYQINSTLLDADFGFDNNWDDKMHLYFNNYNYDLLRKEIYIDNYDPNNWYIINNMKQFEFNNYLIYVKGRDDENFYHIDEYAEYEEYTGNIIFNYPNAKFIVTVEHSGKIVAPNADIFVMFGLNNTFIHDSMFSNSITGIKERNDFGIGKYAHINYIPYSFEKKVYVQESELKIYEDFQDDIYSGSYTINEMLRNYNVITLGQKEYGSNTIFYDDDESAIGSIKLFHIAGQFLANGNVISERIDLESNLINESAAKGELKFYYKIWDDREVIDHYFKRWGDNESKVGTNNIVFLNEKSLNYSWDIESSVLVSETDYINFERLYNSIVEEQKDIKLGDIVSNENGIAKIQIGKNYFINDINEIDEIVFEGFEENSEKMTVITILNNDNINFPKISQTVSGNYVPTKDYFGKAEPMFEYEYYNFPDDIYAGNIIWNIPNSEYIKFETQTPIIGHLVAPNADVEMKETHFAGGFIVNSLYAEGNSEAHFYPLQPVDVPENYDCIVANTNYFNGRWYTDETVLVVNPTAKDVLEPPKEEITNPKTGVENLLSIVLIIAIIISTLFVLIINKKSRIL